MDDFGIVDGDVAGLQFEVDHAGIVDLRGMDARGQDIFAVVDVLQFGAGKQTVVLGAGQDAQTAIFAVGFSGGQPNGNDFHRLQRPVRAVLMPQHFLAVARRLGDVMGGEKGDVGADELLDDIQQTVIAHQPVHKRVIDQHVMMKPFGAGVGMLFGQPMDVFGRFAGEFGIDGIPHNSIAVFIVLLLQRVGHRRSPFKAGSWGNHYPVLR